MPGPEGFYRLSKPWLIAFAVICIVYWFWFVVLIGVEPNDFYLWILISVLYFFNKASRRLFLMFAPFFIYLFFYSSLRVLHLYNPFPISTQELYDLEVLMFGMHYDGKLVSVNEYFIENRNAFSDFFSGLFYITWVPFPILFTFIVFFAKKAKIGFDFWLSFLFANLFGFIGYLFYPAAPPWYFLEYGAEIISDLPGNAAGLARFDKMIGFPLYENMYAQGTNTFGAMPSMHAAFPLLLVYYSLKFRKHLLTLLFLISLVGIWYGAVYSTHHYIIDVLIGIVCGFVGLFITEFLVNRKFVPYWYKKAIAFIREN